MTMRLTIGIDPGHGGAIATLADGEPDAFYDMPTWEGSDGVTRVDGAALAAIFRGAFVKHPGASFLAVVEDVSVGAGSQQADGTNVRRSMGSSSAFRFGKACGAAETIPQALGVAICYVRPQAWKKHFALTQPKGAEKISDSARKERSRQCALALFSSAAEPLKRKKDSGRAEALLMAQWAYETEQVAA